MSDEVRIALIVAIPVLAGTILTAGTHILALWLAHRATMARAQVIVEKVDAVAHQGNSQHTALVQAKKSLEEMNAQLKARLAVAADLQERTEAAIPDPPEQ